MGVKERAARDREIFAAGFAAPAWGAARTAAGIHGRATTMRAVGFALVVGPAEPNEDPLDLLIAHTHHRR